MGGVTEKKVAAQKEEQRQMERRVRYGAQPVHSCSCCKWHTHSHTSHVCTLDLHRLDYLRRVALADTFQECVLSVEV